MGFRFNVCLYENQDSVFTKKNILILSHKLVIILTINLSRKYFLENLSNTLHTMTHAMIGLFFMYLCMIYEGTRLREKKRKQKERKRKENNW